MCFLSIMAKLTKLVLGLSNLTVKYKNSVYFIWYYGFYLYMREV